jgi:uncharacterized repeat protein (TIGR03803 family)
MKIHAMKALLCLAVLPASVALGGNVLAQAQTLTTIHSFTGANGDGEYPYPYGHLPFNSNGALYGTTAGGGASQSGIVYQLVPQGSNWTENVLYTFAGGADGRQPSVGVVFDANGNLFGTTSFGGNLQACGGGCGTVFEVSPPAQPGGVWTHTVLYTFQGSFDGQSPGEVVFGLDGSLYGTTASGGTPGVLCHSNSRIKYGCGTVFRLTPPSGGSGAWTKTIIHTFPASSADGTTPSSEITFDNSGNIYGVTGYGGASHFGTAWLLTPNGSTWSETLLHTFSGGSDGGYPGGTLVAGTNGVFYGTASYSGVANASGVVFQLTQSGGVWSEKVLHTFPAFNGDGTTPASTMAIDASGNLYGTTDFGGSTACNLGCGTVFKLAPPSGSGSWTESVLHDWANSGQNPNATFVTLHNGLLFGVTTYLGSADLGSVFTLTP